MANLNAIQTLTDLAARQSEEAATRLGQANNATAQAQQKLELLQEYRKSYADQLQAQMAQGLSMSGYSNFQKFLSTLDQAIAQQMQTLQNSHHLVEKHRNEWQLSEKKRLSFNTLTQRAEQAQLRKETKREQKQTDEYASRAKSVKL